MQAAPGGARLRVLARQDNDGASTNSQVSGADFTSTSTTTTTTPLTSSSTPSSKPSAAQTPSILSTSSYTPIFSSHTNTNFTGAFLTGSSSTGATAALTATIQPTTSSSSSSALDANLISTPLPATLSTTNTKHLLPTIVGASVGGGAFLLILAAILAFCLRRRSRRQRIAPSSEFLHPEAQEQFRYARSAHTMSMDSGLLSASMEKFPASPPLPSLSPQLDSFFPRPLAASPSPSASRQSTLSIGSPHPAIYSHRARASSAGSVALSSLYVMGENGPGILRGGGSPLHGFAADSSPLDYDRHMQDSTSDGLHIVHEDTHEIGVAR